MLLRKHSLLPACSQSRTAGRDLCLPPYSNWWLWLLPVTCVETPVPAMRLAGTGSSAFCRLLPACWERHVGRQEGRRQEEAGQGRTPVPAFLCVIPTFLILSQFWGCWFGGGGGHSITCILPQEQRGCSLLQEPAMAGVSPFSVPTPPVPTYMYTYLGQCSASKKLSMA